MTVSSSRQRLAAVVSLVALGLGLLGALPVHAQTPSPSPSSSASPSPSPSGSSSATPQSSPSPSSSPSSSPGQDSSGLEIEVAMDSSVLLGQVGDVVPYTIHVEVDEPVNEMTVVASVAPELDVSSVPLNDRADAITASRSGAREDIVWVLGPVSPQTPVDLVWNGVIAATGDLEATSAVQAQARQASASDSAQTFVAAPSAIDIQGVAPPAVAGKVVRFVPVEASAAPGSLIPVTGWSPAGALWAAFASMFLGALLIVVSVTRPRMGCVIAVVMVLGIAAACTPSTDEPQVSAPEDDVQETAEPEPTPSDEVKGIQIRRDEGDDDDDSAGAGPSDSAPQESATEGTDDIASTEPAEVVTTFRRVVIRTPAEEPVTQPARLGDNTVSFEWDEAARSVVTAASSVMFTPDQPSDLLTTLGWDDDGLTSTSELGNATDRSVHVDGTMILEIFSNGALVSTLESDPIDVVLDPGGTVQVDNRYLLPSGEYTLVTRFQP